MTGHGRTWSAGAARFVLGFSLANVVLYHLPLFAFAVGNLDMPSVNGLMTLTTLSVAVLCVTSVTLFLTLMVSRRLTLWLCMVVVLGNSVALYFIVTYQAVLDRTMMGNVFNTDVNEASSYLHPKMLLYFLFLGVVPCVLLSRLRIGDIRRARLAGHAALTLLVSLAWIYAASGTWLWIDKNAKKLGGMVLPWSYVVNAARYQGEKWQAARQQVPLPDAAFADDDPTVVVLVIGEAARAQNFSLYGYERMTNPLMTRTGVIALKDAVSCATYTTAAIACILSPGKAHRSDEPLPTYLARHGVDVVWRANNWGEPPIHVQSYRRARDLREGCTGDGCNHDEVLLYGLAERIASSPEERVFVVLHLRGSHGPSYYKEYPPRFEVFSPVCESVDLNECAEETLQNAYDNTILYTDYVLSGVIDMLEARPDIPSVFLYLSDHGESLGEYGLYLHGTPWSIAPDVQKRIPFLVWASDAFVRREAISRAALSQEDGAAQTNVFHSVLGAFHMQSPVYDPELDLFARARVAAEHANGTR